MSMMQQQQQQQQQQQKPPSSKGKTYLEGILGQAQHITVGGGQVQLGLRGIQAALHDMLSTL